jgi:hypothetical protein
VNDKRPQRAPGASPALSCFAAGAKAVIVLVSILVLLVVSWLNWWWWRPDLFVNPITRQVHMGFLACRDSRQCPAHAAGWQSLVPEFFTVGETRESVTNRIHEAGFEDWVTETDRDYYQASGAAFDPFPCSQIYNLETTFDAADRLLTARSSFSGTPSCL